jgi:hypothetical protein
MPHHGVLASGSIAPASNVAAAAPRHGRPTGDGGAAAPSAHSWDQEIENISVIRHGDAGSGLRRHREPARSLRVGLGRSRQRRPRSTQHAHHDDREDEQQHPEEREQNVKPEALEREPEQRRARAAAEKQ